LRRLDAVPGIRAPYADVHYSSPLGGRLAEPVLWRPAPLRDGCRGALPHPGRISSRRRGTLNLDGSIPSTSSMIIRPSAPQATPNKPASNHRVLTAWSRTRARLLSRLPVGSSSQSAAHRDSVSTGGRHEVAQRFDLPTLDCSAARSGRASMGTPPRPGASGSRLIDLGRCQRTNSGTSARTRRTANTWAPACRRSCAGQDAASVALTVGLAIDLRLVLRRSVQDSCCEATALDRGSHRSLTPPGS